jgi:hypothetical protein
MKYPILAFLALSVASPIRARADLGAEWQLTRDSDGILTYKRHSPGKQTHGAQGNHGH